LFTIIEVFGLEIGSEHSGAQSEVSSESEYDSSLGGFYVGGGVSHGDNGMNSYRESDSISFFR
jgi:hypothetical protein